MIKSDNKIIISIEGNIGVGKTTFINFIKDKIDNSIIVDEPVDEWIKLKDNSGSNLLETYYNDNYRWAYSFQNMVCLTKMEKLLKILSNPNNIDKKYFFLDRCVETDLNVFSKMYLDINTYSQLEYNMFCKFYQIYKNNFKPSIKHIHIYLRASPEICLERIKKRNRIEEKNISLEYLIAISNYHDQWLLSNSDTIIFDMNSDFITNIDFMDILIETIKKKIIE